MHPIKIVKYALPAFIMTGIELMPFGIVHGQTAAVENIQTSKVKEAQIAVAPEDMFVNIQLPGHQIYAGEMIRVEYDVYVFSGRGEVFYEVEEPDFMLWYSIEGSAPKPGTAVFNGKSYTREPFAVYFATPVTTGKIALPTLKVQVPYKKNTWITHEPSFVEVLPLPKPSPSGFAFGNVGQFEIRTELSSHEVMGGEIVTVMVHVKGNAPVAGIRLAPYALTTNPDALRLFPVINDEMKEDVIDNEVVSTRSFRFRMEALQPGTWTIDPFEMVIFDPKKSQYETLKTEAMTIHVSGTAAAHPAPPSELGTLIIDKHPTEKLTFEKAPSGIRLPIHLMWIAPFILLCTAVAVFIRKKKKSSAAESESRKQFAESLETFKSTDNSDIQLRSMCEILTNWFGIEISGNAEEFMKTLCTIFSPEDAALLQNAHRELKRASYSTREAITGEHRQTLAQILQDTPRHGGRG